MDLRVLDYNPANRILTVFILGKNGRYSRDVAYAGEDVLKTSLFESLELRMEEVVGS